MRGDIINRYIYIYKYLVISQAVLKAPVYLSAFSANSFIFAYLELSMVTVTLVFLVNEHFIKEWARLASQLTSKDLLRFDTRLGCVGSKE